jgi:hypothetical protein
MIYNNYLHIIITSAPRSGSTALAKLLGRQEDMFVTNELGFYEDWSNQTKWRNFIHTKKWINFVANEDIFESHGLNLYKFREEVISKKLSGEGIYKWIVDNTNVSIVGDKCPIAYLNNMPYLLDRFPTAKFIVVVRDGRDVVASQIRGYHRWPPGDPDHAPHWMIPNVKDAQRLWWALAQTTALRIRTVPRNRLFWFRYEDAVLETEKFCSNLSAFLGVDIKNIDGYFRPTNMGRWEIDHPDMMSELSKDFKDMLDYFNYKE